MNLYFCEICKKSFSRSDNLQRHIRSSHIEEKFSDDEIPPASENLDCSLLIAEQIKRLKNKGILPNDMTDEDCIYLLNNHMHSEREFSKENFL